MTAPLTLEALTASVPPDARDLWKGGTRLPTEREGVVIVSFDTFTQAIRAFGHGHPWRLALAGKRLEVVCNGDVVGFWEQPRVRLGGGSLLPERTSNLETLEVRVSTLEEQYHALKAEFLARRVK